MVPTVANPSDGSCDGGLLRDEASVCQLFTVFSVRVSEDVVKLRRPSSRHNRSNAVAAGVL